jgi:hypothetical protein
MKAETIIFRADLHRPSGWTLSGWRRAWRRGQTHAGRMILD